MVRVAGEAWKHVEAGRAGHRSALFRCARHRIERDPPAALRARAVWIHGYADATGVQLELIATLEAGSDLEHA